MNKHFFKILLSSKLLIYVFFGGIFICASLAQPASLESAIKIIIPLLCGGAIGVIGYETATNYYNNLNK